MSRHFVATPKAAGTCRQYDGKVRRTMHASHSRSLPDHACSASLSSHLCPCHCRLWHRGLSPGSQRQHPCQPPAQRGLHPCRRRGLGRSFMSWRFRPDSGDRRALRRRCRTHHVHELVRLFSDPCDAAHRPASLPRRHRPTRWRRVGGHRDDDCRGVSRRGLRDRNLRQVAQRRRARHARLPGSLCRGLEGLSPQAAQVWTGRECPWVRRGVGVLRRWR